MSKIKILNFFFLIIGLSITIIWGFLGVFVYFILASFVIIYGATKAKGISKYIKAEYPEIYEKRKMVNRMTMQGDQAVNLFALTPYELNSFSNKKIVEYIYGFKMLRRTIIASFICILLISACKYYIHYRTISG